MGGIIIGVRIDIKMEKEEEMKERISNRKSTGWVEDCRSVCKQRFRE